MVIIPCTPYDRSPTPLVSDTLVALIMLSSYRSRAAIRVLTMFVWRQPVSISTLIGQSRSFRCRVAGILKSRSSTRKCRAQHSGCGVSSFETVAIISSSRCSSLLADDCMVSWFAAVVAMCPKNVSPVVVALVFCDRSNGTSCFLAESHRIS